MYVTETAIDRQKKPKKYYKEKIPQIKNAIGH
jgi:hypothetical protein